MNRMPRLFSYGSLQEPAVQIATFGRVLSGQKDELIGFEPGTTQRANRLLANVIRSAGNNRHVPGMVFEVTEAELLAADEYERPDGYVRIVASLASGGEAWVYRALKE
jgi:gamma-glutamylcyclotransferase (GGCT)/AIG2-like uncharacterized protein YtfP